MSETKERGTVPRFARGFTLLEKFTSKLYTLSGVKTRAFLSFWLWRAFRRPEIESEAKGGASAEEKRREVSSFCSPGTQGPRAWEPGSWL